MSKSVPLVLSMEESDSPTPKSRNDFSQILLESVNESISLALGLPQTPELIHHLQPYIGLSVDKMSDNVDLLFSSLRDSFGTRASDIITMITRRMYEKAGIMTFYDITGTDMIQHVYELKRKLEILKPEVEI
jgi:hypothetical protein